MSLVNSCARFVAGMVLVIAKFYGYTAQGWASIVTSLDFVSESLSK